MNLNDFAYKIFHIVGHGESHVDRSILYNNLDSFLADKIYKIKSDTILISNEDEYFKFNNKFNILNPKSEFKWGELGIWASNLLAIKEFLKTNKKYLMLMEDDISVLNKNYFIEMLKKSTDCLPEDWDFFSYFAPEGDIEKFNSSLHSIENNDFIVKAYQDWSMLCYVINRKTAKKILKISSEEGINMPIDWFIYRQPNLFNAYTLSPLVENPCKLYNTVSTFQLKEEYLPIPEKRVMTRKLAEELPNWFLGNKTQDDFNKFLEEFKGQPNLKFLEIGSFCGNSAAWTIENILTDATSTLTCVDPWNGNVAHEDFQFSDVEAAFDEQLEPFKKQLIKQKAYSDEWLMKNRSNQYDFIYIDGDHMPQAFMSDAILSWELLKPGGIMAIDDYEWQHPRGAKYNPKEAIDLFISMYSEHIQVIEKGWQIWIRKNIDYVRPEHIHE
jgi:GR25 family glycosyltransferase involved in LPS biosynthesis/predicted O-methyltransferase YrrM